jgi:hypothetical protein
MQSILQMLLKVLHHTVRQCRVHLTRTIVTPDPWQVHRPAAFRGTRAGGRRLRWAEDGVGGGGDEVGFHQGLELRVGVAGAQGGDACVEPGRGVGLLVEEEDVLGGMRMREMLRGGDVGTYGCVVWFGPARGFYAAVFVVDCAGLAA